MRSPGPYRVLVLLLGTLTACAAAAATANSGQSTAPRPAVWLKHDLVVRLQNLPKRYSCDDLWYKFRDVLLAIGARPNMQILAYRCESVLGVLARSPSVHLQFETPELATGAQLRWSDFQARPSTVRLEPGQPHSLDTSDCELLRQIKAALLPAVSDRVVGYHLACQAPPADQPKFSLSVQVLTPASAGDTRVASRSDPTPKLTEAISPPATAPVH